MNYRSETLRPARLAGPAKLEGRPQGDSERHTGCDILLVEDLGQQRLPARTLAAVLRQAGFRVLLADLGTGGGGDELRVLAAEANRLEPRLVILSVLFASRVPDLLELASALRGAGVPAHITMTGPFPSFTARELLTACPALDSVLCGEAEAFAARLAAWPPKTAEPPAAPGLAYRSADGEIRLPESWPEPVTDLDDLPYPLHDDHLPAFCGYGFATVEASRGCYHSCTFCLPCAFYAKSRTASGSGRPPYRLRSVRSLVGEIEELYRRGTRLFLFDDEQFLPPEPVRAARVAAFEEELARRGLKIAFTMKCRSDDVEAGLFRQLRRMGLLRVYVGVESGCQSSLDLFGKGVNAERNLEALATLDDLGIVADFFDLLFHPQSSLETVKAEIAFCRRAAAHISTPLRFNEVGILAGTRLAERLQAAGRCGGDPWSWSYRIPDPRVELLRRLNQLVFGTSAARRSVDRDLTASWFALLLERRFEPASFDEALTHRLRAVVGQLNCGRLAVWDEMLDFARSGRILEASPLNEAAGSWAARVNLGCVSAASALAELGLPGQMGTGSQVVPLC